MPKPLIHTQRDLDAHIENDSAGFLSPYGKRGTRWIKPATFVVFLMLFDQEAIFAIFTVITLISIYLPVTFLRMKWKPFRRERLQRFWIYLIGAALSGAIYLIDQSVAMERAENLVAAIESFRQTHQQYPESLDNLDLVKAGGVNLEPCLIRPCGKFRYQPGQLQTRATLRYSDSALLYNTRMYGFSPDKPSTWVTY